MKYFDFRWYISFIHSAKNILNLPHVSRKHNKNGKMENVDPDEQIYID